MVPELRRTDYQDFFENAVVGVFRTTAEGQFIMANPALASMLGFASPDELIRERTDLLRQHYVDSAPQAQLRQLLETQGFVCGFEYEAYRKDASKIWISENARAIKDENGTLLYYEGIAEDISRRAEYSLRKSNELYEVPYPDGGASLRKGAEAALRASEERYRELFENAKDAIYVHDLRGTYTSVNRAAERLSGYTRDEILDHNFADFIAREDIGKVREKLGAKLARKVETAYEVEVIAKDGHRVPVEVSSRSIYENGVVVGVQGMARDITERKQAQEALQMFSRQLIEAQEEERQRIARELHDQIGQALTAVRLNLETVQRLCYTPEASPYIKDNIDVVDDALRLVRDLSGDLRPPQLDDLGLVTALRWYVNRYAQRVGTRTDVLVELPDNDERFSRDLETACFRIAQEALTNVVRHAQAKRVSVQLTRNRSVLLLAVKDDGVGFDLTTLLNRAPRTATLGLLGMQERAHAVGGTIEINSVVSKGTEVRFRFPIRAKRKTE